MSSTAEPSDERNVSTHGERSVSTQVVAPPPTSPALRAAWLLRVAAIVGVLAAIAGQVLAKGVEGIATDAVVARIETVAATFAYFFGALCWMLELWGSIEMLRARRAAVASRVVLVAASAIVVTLSLLALGRPLPTVATIVLSVAAIAAVLAAAWNALREPHTRAVGVVLGAFGLAAIARLAGWELAMSSGDGAGFSPQAVALSRGFATIGVVFEAVGQLAAAAWLGTRGRLAGQLLSSVAVLGAFVVTYGVARGATSGVFWQMVLHKALGDAAGSIPPFGLSAIAVFLASAGILLALVAAVQPQQIVAVVAALALTLLSRGNFDAPLRALAACTAAHWITVAMADDRAMWRMLLDARARKLPAPSAAGTRE